MATTLFRILAIAAMFTAASHAMAAVEKITTSNPDGEPFYWSPKLPVIAGWTKDKEESNAHGFNALVPAGQKFSESGTVIFAQAIPKSKVAAESFEQFVENDKNSYVRDVPDLTVTPSSTLLTADGQPVTTVEFVTPEGNRERVGYLEEKGYYIVFTLTSNSESGLKEAMPAFEKLISTYKAK